MGDRRVLVVLVLVLGVISQWAVAGSARATECPNEQLRAEQPYGLTLPDCRAYELVSPIYKADNDIIFGESRASISDQAPAITYISPGTFAEPKAAQLYDRYVSREGPDGWLTQNITPVYSSFGENELTPAFKELLFTPDLSEGIVKSEHTPLLSGEPAGHINYYVADIGSGTYQLVTLAHSPIEKLYAGPVRPGVYAVGASTDLTHVFFGDQGNLTSSSEVSEGYHLYEWVDGTLSLVDVPPPGMEFRAQDTLGAGYATQLGGPETTGGIDAWHAVSADGTRAFFTAGEGEERKEAAGQVFVRENPEQPQSPYVGGKCAVSSDACTVELSASQRTDCNVQRKIKEPGFVCTGAPEPDPNDHAEPTNGDPHGLRPARYWSASADGSRVFFTSAVELTDDANTGPDDNASNLYEYDVENGMLTDLTVDTNPEDPAGAAVLGVATASEDGSYVYFVAEGRLTSVENAESEKPVLGKPNLYLYHAGKMTFIATLAPATEDINAEEGGDAEDWYGVHSEHSEDFEASGPAQHSVRVSGDGTRLAFESIQSLTGGYDNEPAEPQDCTKKFNESSIPCREVYLYDAVTGRLVCASCDRSGARPVGPAELGGTQGGGVSVLPSSFYVPRNFSEDGGRLFFQSPDALVPHDSNGRVDVYEWESEGEGGCVQSDGCVYPISDVAGGHESYFMDATPSGDNVFIWTRDQLVPSADGDTRANVYDVRVGGGFPVSVAPPACTNGDSCKGPVSPQPGVFGAPASATFSGEGNLAAPPAVLNAVKPRAKPKPKPKRCRKGFARKHGRCVKRTGRAHSKRVGGK